MGDPAKALANLLDRTATVRALAGQPNGLGNPPASTDIGPNIFTAVQEQLGLKPGSSKGPVEVQLNDLAAENLQKSESLRGVNALLWNWHATKSHPRLPESASTAILLGGTGKHRFSCY